MSVQSQIDRLAAAKAAIKTAIEGKGVTVPDATALDGFAALIEAIEAGGGGIDLPDGCILATGSFTPTTSGQDVLHKIKIAKSLGAYPYIPVRMFCIVRADGFAAGGMSDTRYLVSYCAISAAEAASIYDKPGGGVVVYRKNGAFVAGGGVESSTTKSYGIPMTGSGDRSNTLIRSVSADGILTFSSYGLICLEPSKEYRWYAIIGEGATV